jgi:hypothetical protein
LLAATVSADVHAHIVPVSIVVAVDVGVVVDIDNVVRSDGSLAVGERITADEDGPAVPSTQVIDVHSALLLLLSSPLLLLLLLLLAIVLLLLLLLAGGIEPECVEVDGIAVPVEVYILCKCGCDG